MSNLRSHLGNDKAKAFDKIYALRCAFVHDGEGQGDMQSQADKALSLASALLESQLTSEPGVGRLAGTGS